jgi:DNA-directed RNA polymerase subunit RPC12/RpoP
MSDPRNNNNFKCPKCGFGAGSQVTDSRAPMAGTYIRRRRKCNACGHKFSTQEKVWTDDPEDPNTIKPEDILLLRALATEILNRTSAMPLPPASKVLVGYPAQRRPD